MADEEKASASEAQDEPKKSKSGLLLILGLLGGGVLAAVGLYLGGLLGSAEARDQVALNRAVEVAVQAALSEMEQIKAEQQIEEETKLEVTQVLELDPFIVNLEGAGSALTYARIGVGFGFNSEDPEVPVVDPQLLLPKIKDYLLGHISKKSLLELTGTDNRQQIKEEIRQAVAQMIPPEKGQLVEVYLTEFLLQ